MFVDLLRLVPQWVYMHWCLHRHASKFEQLCVCRLPGNTVAILLLDAPRNNAAVKRMIQQSGIPVLPALRNRRGSTCMWSPFFSSLKVPRAMVVESSTGSIVCGDAIHSIHRKDISNFPWQPTPWSSNLVGAVMAAHGTTNRTIHLCNACILWNLPADLASVSYI
jgi:hypothetical protein